RLVRAPVGVDVGAVLQEERCYFKVSIQNGPGERDVQNLLRGHWSPTQVGALKIRIAARMVARERSQDWLAGCVEPPRHGGGVAGARRMRQGVGQRPDASQQRKEARISVVERVDEGRRPRWRLDAQ